LEFEWDEAKRQSIIAERQVDILFAAAIFNGLVVTEVDRRRDYGEERLMSLGLVDGEAYVVVHTERDGITRVITAWKGGRSGKRKYQASLARRDQPHER
jgi:uncharacterized DUF497 family protein